MQTETKLKYIISFQQKLKKLFRDLIYQLNWVMLSQLGRSNFIKSFSIWLVVVPLLAKFFNKLPKETLIQIYETKIILVFELPFNLSLFYFCSLFFGLASIIYSIKCPSIIKDYKNSNNFILNGGNKYQLIEFSKKLDNEKTHYYTKKLEIKDIASSQLIDIYSELVKDYRLLYRNYRLILGILYFLGFILLLIIFFQNTITVLGL